MKTALISLVTVLAMIATGLSQVGTQSAAPVAVSHLSHKQVKHLIATASTSQDHLVLAEYFRWKAGKMKEEEEYHLEMAAIYRLHPLPFDGKQAVHMQDHCKYFADKARDAAIADDEMASVQERIADQIQSGQPYRAMLMNVSSSAGRASHQTLTGVISDDMCGQKHMMPGHSEADCTRACVKAGSKYALVVGDKAYVLKGDPKQFGGFAGEAVSVTGELTKNLLTIQSISDQK